jgi:preprotein translocase subunit SecG
MGSVGYTILLIIQVIVSIGIILLILLQQGKGADAGAAFGSGASSTVFGARGSSSFFSRTTAILAVIFFSVSLTMFIMVKRAKGKATEETKPGVTQPKGPGAGSKPKANVKPASKEAAKKDSGKAEPAKKSDTPVPK